MSPPIILVGFNRSGTTSLHRLFKLSGIPSAHWTLPDGRNIAVSMLNNIALGRRPFAGMAPTRAFCDINYLDEHLSIEGGRFFRALHAAYPAGYFILNTRPVEDWIASREAHSEGRYLTRYAHATGLTEGEVREHWRRYHRTHTDEVLAHFEGNPRFLYFDITRDDPARIARLVEADYSIDPAHWGVCNRGPSPRTSPATPGRPAPTPAPASATPSTRSDPWFN